jgi:hypothetical protein
VSHASPSGSHRVIGRLKPAAKAATQRLPPGEVIARVVAVVSGTVLVATLGLLLASTFAS